MKIRKKYAVIKSSMLLFLLSLISLMSCEKDDPEDEIRPMYGVVTAEYQSDIE